MLVIQWPWCDCSVCRLRSGHSMSMPGAEFEATGITEEQSRCRVLNKLVTVFGDIPIKPVLSITNAGLHDRCLRVMLKPALQIAALLNHLHAVHCPWHLNLNTPPWSLKLYPWSGYHLRLVVLGSVGSAFLPKSIGPSGITTWYRSDIYALLLYTGLRLDTAQFLTASPAGQILWG